MQKKLFIRMAEIATICVFLLTPLTTATANATPSGNSSTHAIAAPMTPAGLHGTSLTKVEWMYAGDYIMSANGEFTLEMQADGNLVEYWFLGGSVGKKACWASNTNGQPGDYVVYQQDGNLVVYDTNNNARWASNTAGKAGTTVDISLDLREYGFLYVGYTAISTTANGSFRC